MGEPDMLQYTMEKNPVLANLNFFIASEGNTALSPTKTIVTTQGFAKYVKETIPCIESMRTDLKSVYGKSPDYITGHSLGGSAATVYMSLANIVSPGIELVTFGAPATTQMDPTIVADYQINFKTGAPKTNPITNEIKSAEGLVFTIPSFPGSTRFFHKFDPAPGFYF